MRNAICEVGMVIASIFWSSLVTEVNAFSTLLKLPHAQQELCSVVILLCFLLVLPYIFDWVARNYECMKLESEIQNSIMNRYFWYQLINVYVTVGLGSRNFAEQLLGFLRNPQSIVDVLGKSVPAVSLYFCNLMIVKIFAAVPIEMLRPWQLSTIHLMYASMDTRKATRRDLRSGAFYAWPMLYGWVYPQVSAHPNLTTITACPSLFSSLLTVLPLSLLLNASLPNSF
jgi:Calcium-dependent channel, 7TM region, putative phosphate